MWELLSEEVYVNLVLELPLQTLTGVPAHTQHTLMHTNRVRERDSERERERERGETALCCKPALKPLIIAYISMVISLA